MLELANGFGAALEMVLEAIAGNFWLAFLFIFLIAIGAAVFILGLFVPSTPVLLFAVSRGQRFHPATNTGTARTTKGQHHRDR